MSDEILPMSASRTYLSRMVMPGDTNNHGTLFGGLLMKYIDEVAAMSAIRHTRKGCVTASNDGVHFHKPIVNGHFVELESYVSSVGRTSLEIFVKIITENTHNGERSLAGTSFLTFVALDKQGQPTTVPDVYPESEEEKLVYADRKVRREARRKKREKSNELMQQLKLR